LNSLDRFFWTTLRRFWSRWTDVLVIVKRRATVAGISDADLKADSNGPAAVIRALWGGFFFASSIARLTALTEPGGEEG
jgi:hypothetical protein